MTSEGKKHSSQVRPSYILWWRNVFRLRGTSPKFNYAGELRAVLQPARELPTSGRPEVTSRGRGFP